VPDLYSFFGGLSPVLQAAFVGIAGACFTAVVTLTGVVLTVRSNRKSEREERYLNLKREVFLEAARNYAAAVQLIAESRSVESFSSAPMQEINTAFGASVGKILLVGNDRSMKAWLNLQTAFFGILARLAANGMHLQAAYQAFLEKKAQLERASTSADMAPTEALDGLKAALGYYKALRTQLQTTVEETEKLLPLTIEATLAAKEELGISVNETAFARISGQSSEEARAILKELITTLNEQIILELESLKNGERSQGPGQDEPARTS
jgi:hypothetical protein